MKSLKVLALVVGSIALLPTVSFADNVSGKSQEANLSSVTVGHGNLTVTDTKQSIIDLQQSGHLGTNVGGTAQKITGSSATVGIGNVDIKKAMQEATNAQQAK